MADKHYDKRVLFYIGHFSKFSILHRNDLAAMSCVSRLDLRLVDLILKKSYGT